MAATVDCPAVESSFSAVVFCINCGTEAVAHGNYCAVCGSRFKEVNGAGLSPRAKRNLKMAIGLTLAAFAVGAVWVIGGGGTADHTPATNVALVPPSATPTDIPTPTAVPSPTVTPAPTVVPTPTRIPVQINNGTEMQVAEGSGLGELTVDNGTTNDAIIKLFDPSRGHSIRAVYVVRQSKWVIKNIPPGVFVVRYASGRDWDAEGRFFQSNAAFSEFEDTIDFAETPTSTGTTYTTWSITLQPVLGGTADTEKIDAAKFAQ